MKTNTLISLNLFLAALLLGACESKQVKKGPSIKSSVPTLPSISLSKDQIKLMDIQLQHMEDRIVYPVVYANGVVAARPNHDAALTPRISGVIDEIFVLEGSNVQKGQAIMSISSTELIQMQQDYMSALADSRFLEKDYERQTLLKNSNIGALSDFQLAESKYLNAISSMKTLKAKLEMQGIDVAELNDPANAKIKTVKIMRSPISGFIHNMPARIGMRAEPATVLAEIIDLSELRADVYVYEKDLSLITENQDVEIQFINKSIPSVSGKIEYVSRTIDKLTRSIVIHTAFKAPKGYLVMPEMSITVKIKGINAGKSKKTVPQTAVYDDNDQSFIFYTTSADTAQKLVFRKAKVKTGSTDGSWVELDFEEPVPANAVIATTNTFNIDSEFKKQNSGN